MRKNMDVVPCKSAHFKEVSFQESQDDMGIDEWFSEEDDAPLSEWGRTILIDGRASACFGVSHKHGKVFEGWLLFSAEVVGSDRKYGYSIASVMRGELEKLFAEGKADRIQATCVAGDTRESDFLEALGFERELGTMKRYGLGGEDHEMHAMMRERWQL